MVIVDLLPVAAPLDQLPVAAPLDLLPVAAPLALLPVAITDTLAAPLPPVRVMGGPCNLLKAAPLQPPDGAALPLLKVPPL